MSKLFDLHSHSTASDGSLSPTELVQRAAQAGVDVLALTDHDTTEGLAEAMRAGRSHGVDLSPGIEISVTWGGQTVHIVGLNIDHECPELLQGLNKLKEFRLWRAEEIGRRLAKKGIEGAFEGAKAFSNGRLISRTHFARFLVAQGVEQDMRGVFKRYLVHGKPGHVAGQWASLEDAVGWIRTAGGQAVVAHPARYKMTRTKLRKLFKDFKQAGGEALEVVSGSHSKDDGFVMARHCRDFNFFASAGSDYHGPESPYIELGRLRSLPDGCVPIWRDWPQSRPAVVQSVA